MSDSQDIELLKKELNELKSKVEGMELYLLNIPRLSDYLPLKFQLTENDIALYEKAVQLVIEHQKASASFLQRQLQIGYARAAMFLDRMEESKVVGPVDGAKPRKVLMKKQ